MDLGKLDEPLPVKGREGVLYFDIETVPDYERMRLFDLDVKKRAEVDKCPATADLLKQTLDKIKEDLKFYNPCDEYLDSLDAAEKAAAKPRKGVFDATKELRNQDVDLRKTMSLTPEFNRMVALGWSLDGDTGSAVVGQPIIPGGLTNEEAEVIQPTWTETLLVNTFWSLAKRSRHVCGFNVLGFDLPTIFVRSMLLDIPPTKQWDMKPWSADVIDLMKKRFPAGPAMGLKRIAKAMGIEIPAGDVDGSQVEELLKNDPVKLGEYVKSDVVLSVQMHTRYIGFFC